MPGPVFGSQSLEHVRVPARELGLFAGVRSEVDEVFAGAVEAAESEFRNHSEILSRYEKAPNTSISRSPDQNE
jgi:hypothetical protein